MRRAAAAVLWGGAAALAYTHAGYPLLLGGLARLRGAGAGPAGTATAPAPPAEPAGSAPEPPARSAAEVA
jgi:hypothetical protein